MATDDQSGGAKYEIPDTDEYEKETAQLRDVELPVMGFALPVYQRPPGRLMALMEDMGLSGLFGPGEADVEEMVDDDGTISLNTLMRDEVIPNIATEETDKDAFHWNNGDLKDDPEVDDFDVSALKDEDLAALIKGMMTGGEDPEEQLEQFQG